MFELIVVEGPNSGEVIKLNTDQLTLGRDPGLDGAIVFPLPAISRRHASIERI
jgi:pSer/pThr/pTyr-binding forkhead associated (FHA) protein